MDKLIRALEISDQSISLGLRMRSRPPAAVEGLRQPAPVLAARPPEEPVLPDFHLRRQAEENAAHLEIERERIREELKRELDARIESVLQESRSQGLKEGLELAKAEAQREAERQHEAVTQTLATVAEVAERQIAGAEDAIVGIAFESVCKILGRDAVDRKVVRAMVQQVLARVGQEEGVRVHLHPRDCAVLRNGGKAPFPGRNGRMKVELVADEEVGLGGCVVEASGGSLDARLETQVQRLREALLKVRRGGTKRTPVKS
jgi:flagellar assembly protein FliH